jgi:signal transduction histidine kinase
VAQGGSGARGDGPARPEADELLAHDLSDRPLLSQFGRWSMQFTGAANILVASGYVVVIQGMAILGALDGYTPVSAIGIVETLLIGALLLVRTRAPVILLGATLVIGTAARLADSGLERNSPVVTVYTFDPSAAPPIFDAADAPRIAPVALAAVAILVVTIGLERRSRVLLIASCAAAAYVLASTLVFGGEGARTLDAARGVGVIVLAALIGSNVRDRLRWVVELEDRARRLALERDQREQLAVSSERNRIAREMHDILAHSLSVMVTLADGANRTLGRDPERARAALDRLAGTGREALADTRRMVGMLREDSLGPEAGESADDVPSAPLTPHPAVRDLSGLIDSFAAAGLPVSLDVEGPPLPDDTSLQLTVYRIVQECLTNVLRYAAGSPRIRVEVAHRPGRVRIAVDNDKGARSDRAADGTGRGLIGLRERAAVFNGTVEAGPTPTGWRVEAVLHIGSNGEIRR